MPLAILPAAIVGLVGGFLMTLTRMALRIAGVDLRLDVLRMWGSLLPRTPVDPRVLGLVIHLAGSAAIAVLFAWAFEILAVSSAVWLWGLVGGFVLWVAAGVFLAIVPLVHREIPEQAATPGAFARNLGRADVVAFLVGHLLYGVVVGVLYASLHPRGALGTTF